MPSSAGCDALPEHQAIALASPSSLRGGKVRPTIFLDWEEIGREINDSLAGRTPSRNQERNLIPPPRTIRTATLPPEGRELNPSIGTGTAPYLRPLSSAVKKKTLLVKKKSTKPDPHFPECFDLIGFHLLGVGHTCRARIVGPGRWPWRPAPSHAGRRKKDAHLLHHPRSDAPRDPTRGRRLSPHPLGSDPPGSGPGGVQRLTH